MREENRSSVLVCILGLVSLSLGSNHRKLGGPVTQSMGNDLNSLTVAIGQVDALHIHERRSFTLSNGLLIIGVKCANRLAATLRETLEHRIDNSR